MKKSVFVLLILTTFAAGSSAALPLGGHRGSVLPGPLGSSVERDLQLQPSAELLSAPIADEQQRSAAAALWRALAAEPQDIARDAEKSQALENSLSALRVQIQKNQLALNELNSQLVKARLERYANWLVYTLGLLLLLAIAAAIYFWRRRALLQDAPASGLVRQQKNRPTGKSWADALSLLGMSAQPQETAAEEDKLEKLKLADKKEPKSPRSTLGLGAGPDQSALTPVEHFPGLGTTDPVWRVPSSLDLAMEIPQIARTVKAEELFDIQQRVDFFVTLGQHEQALELLRQHIMDNALTSPLIYMGLFNLYHQLDRKSDYEGLRHDFYQLFTGKIPNFELYDESSSGLDAYPVALTRIEALWPSPEVLEIIEECILRRPVANADAFDLGAYRELLLLYAVARELIRPEGGKAGHGLRFAQPDVAVDDGSKIPSFSTTLIQPMSASAGEGSVKVVEPILTPPSLRVRLDVDLSHAADLGDTQLANAQPSSSANFFARLGAKMPVVPAAHSSTVAPPDVTPLEVDNMIDFDEFNASVKEVGKAGPGKI